jgi:EF-P beta-lysylation protein EpmB
MQPIQLVNTHESPGWQTQLANAITSTEELLKLLGLEHLLDTTMLQPDFRLRVPRAYVTKMQPGDASDPLLKQVLPCLEETAADGVLDPVGDLDAMSTPGLLHKYQGRVLLVTTGACAIHCRYCFRRHFPYSEANPARQAWQQALGYIKQHQDVNEVILSGGDPLVMDNAKLRDLLQQLESIPHVTWLRIHTRLPVVLPARIDDELLELLQQSRFTTSMIIHANHANELGADEIRVLGRLADAGIRLLNQSVLLRGVNDNSDALLELSQRLYEAGVLPYYLHLLDPVQGAMHFNVPENRAVQIIENLSGKLPGFLVPRLVREEPGKRSKTAIFAI